MKGIILTIISPGMSRPASSAFGGPNDTSLFSAQTHCRSIAAASQITKIHQIENSCKQEKPAVSYRLSFKIWHRPTLPRVTAVPSALAGLTSLFGMGRGRHRRYRHLNIFIVCFYSTCFLQSILKINSGHKQ